MLMQAIPKEGSLSGFLEQDMRDSREENEKVVRSRGFRLSRRQALLRSWNDKVVAFAVTAAKAGVS